MLKAVIFDMDGVIVDSEPHHHAIETTIFRVLGITVSDSERHSFVGMANRKMWAALREAHGLTQTVDHLMDLDRAARVRYLSELDSLLPMPGAAALLDQLRRKGLKIGLASSSAAEVIRIVTARLGLSGRFDQTISGDSVAAGKPDPDIFLVTARLLGEDPADCLVIEDSANGVRAAKAAGMTCLGFDSARSGRQDLSGADAVVNDLRQVTHHFLESLVNREGISGSRPVTCR